MDNSAAIDGISIFSSIRFSSMIEVSLSINSLSILFNDSFMIDCLDVAFEEISDAIFFLASIRFDIRLFSRDALKGLVIYESAPTL